MECSHFSRGMGSANKMAAKGFLSTRRRLQEETKLGRAYIHFRRPAFTVLPKSYISILFQWLLISGRTSGSANLCRVLCPYSLGSYKRHVEFTCVCQTQTAQQKKIIPPFKKRRKPRLKLHSSISLLLFLAPTAACVSRTRSATLPPYRSATLPPVWHRSPPPRWALMAPEHQYSGAHHLSVTAALGGTLAAEWRQQPRA
jgi:hypothetical protein